jgi:sec-independent protein translocase protein TatA
MRLGPVEIGLIVVIVLIVFGVGKLPQVGGALGRGLHEFRKASRDGLSEDKEAEAGVKKTDNSNAPTARD